MISLTKSTGFQPEQTSCSHEDGPDALRLTKGVIFVYKDANVHQLSEQTVDRLPIINITANITSEFKLQLGNTIGAVLGTEKPTYYCNIGNLKRSAVCQGDANGASCQAFTFPNEPLVVAHVSAASVAGDNIFLAFMDDRENEHQAIINDSHHVLRIKKLDNKMADGRKQNPTVLEVLSQTKDTDNYTCLVFFGPIYGLQDEDLNSLSTPVVIRKTIDYQLADTWLGHNLALGHSRWRIDLNKRTAETWQQLLSSN
ncbi:hypothetical protein HDE_00248 [Halotydeus destructor]|nr:hypothetical protein HDE_00248 [Halotydeus destructor]